MSDKGLMSILLYIYNRMDASPTPRLVEESAIRPSLLVESRYSLFCRDCYLIGQPP